MSNSEKLKYFLDKFYVFYDYVTESQGKNPILIQLKTLFEGAYAEKNERKLKKLNSELDIWIRELPSHEKNELSVLLNKRFGKSIEKEETKHNTKINRIIEKGKIKDHKEYRLILQRVEEIFADDNKKSELTILNQLLADFHVP